MVGLDIARGPETRVLGSVRDRALVARPGRGGGEVILHAGALHEPDIARRAPQAFVDVDGAGTLTDTRASGGGGGPV
ncbi:MULTISPECIES: hypothetical protein [unclassified Methylobacterium]|uniref:hypothetical protein n=1 Tax=unclassified Methylobacterium TaxID=2615210 RepID=UPI000152DF9F|nr:MULTISPECIES: hypothetical protein [Methylobacterium]WFT80747.1 hypothetical protein QA634_02245 [Methylobacterium nodulans]